MNAKTTLADLRVARAQELAADIERLDGAVREAMDTISGVPSPLYWNSVTQEEFFREVDMASAEADRLVAVRSNRQRQYDALLAAMDVAP